jgi:quercetin dioxygenase-like cupin family protein
MSTQPEEKWLMTRIGILIGCLAVSLSPLWAIAADDHVAASTDSLKWSPAPPAFPKGAEIAVITGDPGKEGPFVFRLRVPAGYKVPPHTHPADENVTVISGTFRIGMGEKFDEATGTALKAGGFAKAPKGMAHYAWFTEPTVVQVHGVGPTAISYINPADDPRKGN